MLRCVEPLLAADSLPTLQKSTQGAQALCSAAQRRCRCRVMGCRSWFTFPSWASNRPLATLALQGHSVQSRRVVQQRPRSRRAAAVFLCADPAVLLCARARSLGSAAAADESSPLLLSCDAVLLNGCALCWYRLAMSCASNVKESTISLVLWCRGHRRP